MAPPVALAREWDGRDPTGYLVSEKLDGMRCWWDGFRLLTRNGHVISAPIHMVDTLPKGVVLDGELFIGRGKYQETMSIVRCADPALRDWSIVRYMIFDAPDIEGPPSKRLAAAEQSIAGCPWARIIEHRVCKGEHELKADLDRVLDLGGEGLMLKHPLNPYQSGRNTNHMKIKRFYDAEALVVSHEIGKGKHKARLGALQCELPNGKRFKIGTGFTDDERKIPPPIGSLVTFKYQNQTVGGLPRFPVYLRVRQTE